MLETPFRMMQTELLNEQDNFGFVMDYGLLSPIKKWIDDNFDHATIVDSMDAELMDFLDASNNSYFLMPDRANSEAMVELMLMALVPLLPEFIEIVKLRLWETPKSSCTWEKS